MISRNHPRAILTETQAIEIYTYRKMNNNSPKTDTRLSGRSAAVAEKFNVSPKAVRDIWNRRTWTQETQHLWTEDERPIIRTERIKKSSLSSCSTPCCQFRHMPSRPSRLPSISPECAINSMWRQPDYQPIADSCSVYTDDIEQQNHFHSLSIWSQLLSQSIHSINLPFIPSHSSATDPPPSRSFSPLSPLAESSETPAGDPQPTEMAIMVEPEEKEGQDSARAGCPWADEWGCSDVDAAGWGGAAELSDAGPIGAAAGAPDPFALDWPAW